MALTVLYVPVVREYQVSLQFARSRRRSPFRALKRLMEFHLKARARIWP